MSWAGREGVEGVGSRGSGEGWPEMVGAAWCQGSCQSSAVQPKSRQVQKGSYSERQSLREVSVNRSRLFPCNVSGSGWRQSNRNGRVARSATM